MIFQKLRISKFSNHCQWIVAYFLYVLIYTVIIWWCTYYFIRTWSNRMTNKFLSYSKKDKKLAFFFTSSFILIFLRRFFNVTAWFLSTDTLYKTACGEWKFGSAFVERRKPAINFSHPSPSDTFIFDCIYLFLIYLMSDLFLRFSEPPFTKFHFENHPLLIKLKTNSDLKKNYAACHEIFI